MGLILCVTCGKQKTIKPIKRGAKFKCGNCGCRSPLVLARGRGTDRDGVSLEEAKRQTFAGLLRYAELKQFKPGWAARKFKLLWGFYPRGIIVDPAPMIPALHLWVKKQGREWAKAKRKAQQTLFTGSLTAALQSPPIEVDQDGHIPGTLLTPDDLDV